MRVLIIGCGYTGMPTGALLAAAGHEVFGLRRTAQADAELRSHGVQPLRGDITRPESLAPLRAAGPFDAVINVASSSRGGVEEYRAVYLEGTRHLLRWLAPAPPSVYLYTSSTSVYAQSDGDWVSEASPAEPDSPTSRVLIEAEEELRRAHEREAFPMTILRVAGIYGPGRGHLFQQFLQGEATLRAEGENWLNMIHLADLARCLAHLVQHPRPGQTYNLADNEPVTQRSFFAWLAERLHRPMPPSAAPDPNRKRGLTNKRVSNAKFRAETGLELVYPTFREGYESEIRRLGVPS